MDKNLRKLSRVELLELMVSLSEAYEEQAEEARRLREELAIKQKHAQQTQRMPRATKVGSIAEAALQANGYFEAAQRSADDYLREIKRLHDELVKRKEAQEAREAKQAQQAQQAVQDDMEITAQDARRQVRVAQLRAQEADRLARQAEQARAQAEHQMHQAQLQAQQALEQTQKAQQEALRAQQERDQAQEQGRQARLQAQAWLREARKRADLMLGQATRQAEAIVAEANAQAAASSASAAMAASAEIADAASIARESAQAEPKRTSPATTAEIILRGRHSRPAVAGGAQ